MAKRFTDTNKYKKPFIRGLKGPYKLLWDYLYHDCDHAGIWIVDFEVAQLYIGADMPVNKHSALECLNEGELRIIEFDAGKKWFIPSFISFQYGELNPQNRAHNSVLLVLQKNGLSNNIKPLISPLQGAMDKEKDKDIVLNTKEDKLVFEKHFDHINNFFSIQYEFQSDDFKSRYEPKKYLSFQIIIKNINEVFPELRAKFQKCMGIGDWMKHLDGLGYMKIKPAIETMLGYKIEPTANMALKIKQFMADQKPSK